MKKIGVFLVWLLVILFLGSAGGAGWLFLEKERLTREKELLSKENVTLKDRLTRADQKNRTLSQKIERMTIELEALSGEYATLKENYDQALKEKDNLTIEVKGLNEVKIGLSKNVEELESRLVKLSNDKVKLEEELKVVLGRLRFEREIGEVKPGEVELRKIVVRAKPEEVEAVTRREGKVIALSDEYDFVVIDLGEADGIEKGMEFSVYRRGRWIGKIKVIELRKYLSAANVEETVRRRKLREGDMVRP